MTTLIDTPRNLAGMTRQGVDDLRMTTPKRRRFEDVADAGTVRPVAGQVSAPATGRSSMGARVIGALTAPFSGEAGTPRDRARRRAYEARVAGTRNLYSVMYPYPRC